MALMRLPLIINGVNFERAVSRTKYQVEYEDREGENSFFALSGDEYPDIISRRPVIYWPLNALWSSELAQLKAAINASTQVQVYYFDTEQNAPTWNWFHGTIGREEIGIINERGKLFHGMTLTLRSR